MKSPADADLESLVFSAIGERKDQLTVRTLSSTQEGRQCPFIVLSPVQCHPFMGDRPAAEIVCRQDKDAEVGAPHNPSFNPPKACLSSHLNAFAHVVP